MKPVEAARMWMLLQTEKSLGLESVPWKLAAHPAAGKPLLPRPSAPAQQRPVPAGPAALGRPVTAPPPRQQPAVATPASTAARPAPAVPQRPVHPIEAMKTKPVEFGQTPALSLDDRSKAMTSFNTEIVQKCEKCVLCRTRTQTVFGEGALDAQLMFIGEGPGETEDETGRPFVGKAGQLLTKMIGAMGLAREQVYIANVVKCRPPGNRTPLPDEVAACTPYLVKQIQTIRPKVIVTLGLPATQYILATTRPMRELRGIWHDFNGMKVMPTYHPSYVLRSYTPEVRGAVWSDLQKVMQELGMPVKSREFTR